MVTPEFLAFIQQALTGKLPPAPELDAIDPQIKALAEELSAIHLPEWQAPNSPKTAEPTVTGLKQATRVAEYLFKRGVRIHPELEQIRWVATPGGPPGAFDTGLHVTKDENGDWPSPDPDAFYDMEDIQVTQTDDGRWVAVHPRGLSFDAATKTEAYAGVVDQLRQRIERARNEQPNENQ
ncbi:hypothetical protein NDR87_27655 [Nocardia sp. CDC159]|uniref:Uncharacterized protein n=1 Tax=Nocardia pulmonis TaxID=2951408 RepID=A0A9X2EFH9_9NOCA|nr:MULTISPECIES: hypothetical protein [Nocardia]MCM6777268.1 hypothetical protein [Nocardia pulmonis]MCM6790153.1 hypothetical protein [Nocardia sp. CDC159]